MESSDTQVEIENCRRQLRKILDSPDFSGRRQLSEFLQYTCEAAFQGRDHLDQIEIAEHVLHRDRSFNPVDNASVRKLATLTRQRLEAYYAAGGKQDSVILSLPVRSYIPRFKSREELSPGPTIEAVQALATSAIPAATLRSSPADSGRWRYKRGWAFLGLALTATLVTALGVLKAHYD
ncbi:MAG: hypothetical protein JO022_11520, partial [Acidobacteriaceae bacterium]|nr:hypothetical protein [Acidobacteriaceae bacterium]